MSSNSIFNGKIRPFRIGQRAHFAGKQASSDGWRRQKSPIIAFEMARRAEKLVAKPGL
jgi:hypothetical protein